MFCINFAFYLKYKNEFMLACGRWFGLGCDGGVGGDGDPVGMFTCHCVVLVSCRRRQAEGSVEVGGRGENTGHISSKRWPNELAVHKSSSAERLQHIVVRVDLLIGSLLLLFL